MFRIMSRAPATYVAKHASPTPYLSIEGDGKGRATTHTENTETPCHWRAMQNLLFGTDTLAEAASEPTWRF